MDSRIPLVLNNFNTLTWVRDMVDVVQKYDNCRVIIVDNASSYKPLLEWYSTFPCEVVRLYHNHGSRAPWSQGIVDKLMRDTSANNYIVSDPDLDLSSVPGDLIEVCLRYYEIYGNDLQKVGLSLRLDDLPDNPVTASVKGWEGAHFWHPHHQALEYNGQQLPRPSHMSAIDTTFAMYRRGSQVNPHSTGQFRLDPPYMARHLPWYITAENITEEYRYYLDTCNGGSSAWGPVLRDHLGKGKK